MTTMEATARNSDVRAVVAGVEPPDGVKLQKVFFGEDHSGDRSIFVILGVSKKIRLTPLRIQKLNLYKREVQNRIREAGFAEFAYVRFTETRG